jgi:hypothetical protein
MRFHYGAIPEDASFAPEAEGWLPIREPGPVALQLMALPVAFGILLFCGALLYLVFPRELLARTAVITVPIWPLLAILVLFAPVHECLHALAHPHWGASPKSVIGMWISKGVLYAHYEGPMSRNRFLLAGAAPYLVLSLLPIGMIALLGYMAWTPADISALALLSILSILGGVLACGDLLGLGLIALQVPPTALVRNKGWKTYWKKPEQ